jgi:hypothetical protein
MSAPVHVITLEACQVTRSDGPDIAEWCGGEWRLGTATEPLHAVVLSDGTRARVFEWIVRYPDGLCSVLHDDDFTLLYGRTAVRP